MASGINSLSELGFGYYYDADFKYPVAPEDIFNVSTGSVVDLYFGARPHQKDDGKWYTKKAIISGGFPFIFAGLYNKDRLSKKAVIGSDGGQGSSVSFAVADITSWDKIIDDGVFLDMSTNRRDFIHPQHGVYLGEQAASADGVLYHFEFSDTLMVTHDFYLPGMLGLKNSALQLRSDVLHNGNEIAGNQHILLSGAMSTLEESTMMRLMIDNDVDTILYETRTVIIKYLTTNRVLRFTFPQRKEDVVIDIEYASISFRRWFDLGFSMDGRWLKVYINGALVETNRANAVIREYEYTLNMRNVEKVEIDQYSKDVTDLIDVENTTVREYSAEQTCYFDFLDNISVRSFLDLTPKTKSKIIDFDMGSMMYDPLEQKQCGSLNYEKFVRSYDETTRIEKFHFKSVLPTAAFWPNTYYDALYFNYNLDREVTELLKDHTGKTTLVTRQSGVYFNAGIDRHVILRPLAYAGSQRAALSRIRGSLDFAQIISGKPKEGLHLKITMADQFSGPSNAIPMIWVSDEADIFISEVAVDPLG